MRLVFYSDILERKIVRGIQEDTSINENCALLYKRIDRGYNETLKLFELEILIILKILLSFIICLISYVSASLIY